MDIAARNAPGDLVFQRLHRAGGCGCGRLAVFPIDALLHVAAHRVGGDLVGCFRAVEQREQGDGDDEQKQHGAENQRELFGVLFG